MKKRLTKNENSIVMRMILHANIYVWISSKIQFQILHHGKSNHDMRNNTTDIRPETVIQTRYTLVTYTLHETIHHAPIEPSAFDYYYYGPPPSIGRQYHRWWSSLSHHPRLDNIQRRTSDRTTETGYDRCHRRTDEPFLEVLGRYQSTLDFIVGCQFDSGQYGSTSHGGTHALPKPRYSLFAEYG
eukprot:CAMPEP_0196168564 /NCGR_PEP_ID=MMETSP0911-20130528/3280_1 /TAXON_ID=49265 /ORGANISM="Thalassiosira rotula, Strain GSO102" /LENGTH=184 /DNA_ID=CAMNT_0041434573 /DNA_START=304 /DNA_END=858 /DNA_ORIENTATION=+